MTKFCGLVGYSEPIETTPGVWKESIVTRLYYGDVIRNTRRLETSDKINDDIKINNSISIVADAYAYEHFFAIRYVEWMGVRWKVTEVQVERPRLIFTLGGEYHGDETGSSE